jgi:hypothetical protein
MEEIRLCGCTRSFFAFNFAGGSYHRTFDKWWQSWEKIGAAILAPNA